METKQIFNLRKMFSMVESHHKKRGLLIRSKPGSIQNHKEGKLSNLHKVIFFNLIHLPYISFSCSVYMSLLHDDFDFKTLRK